MSSAVRSNIGWSTLRFQGVGNSALLRILVRILSQKKCIIFLRAIRRSASQRACDIQSLQFLVERKTPQKICFDREKSLRQLAALSLLFTLPAMTMAQQATSSGSHVLSGY